MGGLEREENLPGVHRCKMRGPNNWSHARYLSCSCHQKARSTVHSFTVREVDLQAIDGAEMV